MKSPKPLLIITTTILSLIGLIFGLIFLYHEILPTTTPTNPAPGSEPPYNFDYSWTENPYIAHAFGGINGQTYTNSYEAFLSNYQMGHRVFEVDFTLTDDGDTVLLHDLNNQWADHIRPTKDSPFTTNVFLSSLFDGQFHVMSYRTLIDIMATYPDIYIVTDSKYTDRDRTLQEFTQIISYAKTVDASVLDRFIIQIYFPEMLDWIMEFYPWKSVIYTLYQNPDWTPENVREFALESGVKLITLPSSAPTPEIAALWHQNDIKIAVHTINSLDQVTEFRITGSDLFYTDFLLP